MLLAQGWPSLGKSQRISWFYTFQLRKEARWSDDSPVTAEDYAYSWRRFLDPRTAAEYAYQAWYIKKAHDYSRGGSGIEPGDSVEIELNLAPDAINTLRGEVVTGELVAIQPRGEEERDFVVKLDGETVTFRPIDDTDATAAPPEGVRYCRQVLLDFREVGIKVLGKHELQITLENPTPYFLELLGFYPLFPVNRRCLETHGQPGWTHADNLVGNGPFELEFRRIRDRIRLRKSNTYWNRDNIRLDVVDALAVESLTTSLNLFLTGKADWVGELPPTAVREMIKADPPRKDLNPQPFLCSYYYLVNTRRKPLDDVRVRRALSLAIDRQEACDTLLPAGEPPSLSLVPPGIPGYERQFAEQENVELARSLLAEAGYPDGRGFPSLEILTDTQEFHQALAQLIRKQWQRNLGIAVKTRNEEWGAYHSSLRKGEYDFVRRGWIADYNDPNTYIDMFVTGGEQNSTGWGSAEYDQLVEDAAKEPDDQVRMQMLQQAERILMDELPILPIYSYVSKNMVKPYVRGLYNNVQDEHYIGEMWIDYELDGPNEFMKSRIDF